MKKLLVIAGLLFIIMFLIFIQPKISDKTETSFLRIHIRANSNEAMDQYVKYQVKEEIVNAITPLIANCTTFEQAKQVLSENLNYIDEISDAVLKKNGFNYKSVSNINNEYFPTRSYDGYVLESGLYDALVIQLGKAEGDNWWCVVYPPLCFVNTSAENIIYKSKILEIINKFFK